MKNQFLNFSLCTQFAIVLFAILPINIEAQSIAKSDAIEDFKFLNAALENGHGVNYNKDQKVSLRDFISEVESLETAELSAEDFRNLLNDAICQIGCVHTSVRSNPTLPKAQSSLIFPSRVALQKDKLWMLQKDEVVEILSINGRKIADLIQSIKHHIGSDGGTEALSLAYLEYYGAFFISKYFYFPTKYTVTTTNGVIELAAIKKNDDVGNAPVFESSVLRNNRNYLLEETDFLFLNIAKFNKSDRRFFKEVTDRILKVNPKNLVIDLRGNSGGDRKAASIITKYLVNQNFEYTILQPKLKIGQYLNRKGKFFLFLSKMKYNLADFYKSKNSESGRVFTYKYKQSKETYKGNIYVLTDGYTASASTMVTAWLKQYSNAIFVGQQASGGYNGNNGGTFPILTLPNSQVTIRFPAYRLILDADSGFDEGIVPDYIITPSIEDLLYNRNKEMHKVRELIKVN